MNRQCWYRCDRLAVAVMGLGLSLWVSGPPQTLGSDSLWRDESRAVVADKRAGKIGDLLTIVVQQSSTASKDNSTKTGKKSGVDAGINSFFFSPGASALATKKGQLPALKFEGKTEFDGGGSVNNSERIVDRITVRVIDTQPNGNLVVEGTRQTAFAGEVQDMILRGTVRPEDVSANNTVFSYNVAEATIKIVSKGSVTDSQRRGWFTKAWDKLTPF